MSDHDSALLDRILCRALDLDEPDRAAYLDDACAGDGALRESVESLLRAALSDGGLLREGELHRADDWRAIIDSIGEAQDGVAGEPVGPFRLIDVLGRGGMGVVWRAERADGAYEQHVALKLIQGGVGTRELARRLIRERQILARLDHPGIARLLHGGVDERGRPYFAMELVRGRPLLDYCREHGVSRARRLAMFIEIAETVEYAHRHLLVHRDIKPANVLVGDDGRPRLLDFGIAKLLDESSRDGTLTRASQHPMTPRYASPEQLLGEAITTASDVYQLGALLYELLTDRPAFEAADSAPSALVEAARRREPARPSATADVPPDLDAIVMAATRPEPERRYRSAALLADDVRAYLERRPVSAQGDSIAYRARRFADRHRLGVAVAGVALVAVAALVLAVAWGFVNAERERRRAEATGAFLKDMLSAARPLVAQGRDTALLEGILSSSAERIEADLGDRPYAAADVHMTIARTYRTLADYERAEAHAAAAADGFAGHLGDDADETLASRQLLGLTYWDQGRYADSERVLRDAYERALEVLGPTHPTTLDTVSNLGLAVRAQGRLKDAEPLYRTAMELSREALGPESPQTIGTIGNLAFLLAELDRLEEAEPLAVEAAELSREHLGPDDPDTYLAIDKLASLVGQRDRLDEALELHREATAGMRRLLGERHSTTLGSAYATAIVLRRLERYDESIATLERILPIIREDYGPESRFMFPTLNELGRSLLGAGRPDEALPRLETARDLAGRLLTTEHHMFAVVSIQYADALVETGHPERAAGILRDARAVLESTFGADGSHRYFDDLVRVEGKLADA